MVDIDYIMELIDWNKSEKEQLQGIRMAQEVQSINVFLQPCNKRYNKNVWDNCAQILAKRKDEELSPYLIDLFRWLQDLNWPGAFCVFDRLKRYSDVNSFNYAYDICLKCAKALGDEVWLANLQILQKEKRMGCCI